MIEKVDSLGSKKKKKTVGLTKASKKMLQFDKRVKVDNSSKDPSRAAFFYVQSKSFFRIFKKNFKNGCDVVITKPNDQLLEVPNQDITANLVIYHFAVELILKALLTLKTGRLDEDDKNHEIHKLLVKIVKKYPKAKEIQDNAEYRLLFEELGNNFKEIRYAEGVLLLRGNNKRGWQNKKPLQELSEALDSIYLNLLSIFDEERKLL